MLHLPVVSNRRGTPTTRILRVAMAGNRFPYTAGQWAELGTSAESLKPYSIASAPCETTEHGALEFLIRDDGSGSELVGIRRGQTLYAEGPHGHFTLGGAPLNRQLVLLAGGTGIAPLRSMLIELLAAAAPPPITLLYSARSANEFAYLRELQRYARAAKLTLVLTVTGGSSERWRGLSGRIGPPQIAPLVTSPADTTALVCGPQPFVGSVKSALAEIGVRDVRAEEQ